MSGLADLINTFLHIDKYLVILTEEYGLYIYLLIFVTIFMETGVIVTPFLPGDSLLFAVGALAASIAAGTLNIWILFFVISVAAILGDLANYSIGGFLGARVFSNENSRIFKREYLERTEIFYIKHGNKAIVLGRFFPVIRTFVPFVAGIGKMGYSKFLFYNISGGVLWSFVFLFGGYLFGNIEIVKNNFTIVIFGIIILSIMPAVYHLLKNKGQETNV